MNFINSVIAFVGVFSVLVFFHELGHFSVARFFGVKISIFSIGFGPKLWSRTDKHGTEWRIAAIPLGGYVKFFGDANEASKPSAEVEGLSEKEKEACFQFKPLPQRAAIVAAGPIANFVLSIVMLAAVFMTQGQSYTSPTITDIAPNTAAEAAGLQAGDVIVSLDDFEIVTFEDIATYTRVNANQPVTITFDRNGRIFEEQVTIGAMEYTSPLGRIEQIGVLGIMGGKRIVVERNAIQALWHGTIETGDYIALTIESLGQFVMGQRSVKELGGPIKIGEIAGEVAQQGMMPLVMLTVILSINLGVINLLPIPMLDGGHLLFYAFEAFKKRPLKERTQEYGFRIGVAALLTLMVVVTWNDVISLIDRLGAP